MSFSYYIFYLRREDNAKIWRMSNVSIFHYISYYKYSNIMSSDVLSQAPEED